MCDAAVLFARHIVVAFVVFFSPVRLLLFYLLVDGFVGLLAASSLHPSAMSKCGQNMRRQSESRDNSAKSRFETNLDRWLALDSDRPWTFGSREQILSASLVT